MSPVKRTKSLVMSLTLPDDVWTLIKCYLFYSNRAYAYNKLLAWSDKFDVFQWSRDAICSPFEADYDVAICTIYSPNVEPDFNLSYYYARLQSIVLRSKITYSRQHKITLATHYWKVAIMELDPRWVSSYGYDQWAECMVLMNDYTFEAQRNVVTARLPIFQ